MVKKTNKSNAFRRGVISQRKEATFYLGEDQRSIPKILDKKPLLGSVIVILIVVLIFAGLGFIFSPKKEPPLEPPVAPRTLEERLRPGSVGEDTEDPAPLPSVVSNTSGMIKKVQSDRLIIQGYGSNFADQKSRVLTVIFTDSTITKQLAPKIEAQGLKGLGYLKQGTEISVKGAENLRGKTKFEAEYIIIFKI